MCLSLTARSSLEWPCSNAQEWRVVRGWGKNRTLQEGIRTACLQQGLIRTIPACLHPQLRADIHHLGLGSSVVCPLPHLTRVMKLGWNRENMWSAKSGVRRCPGGLPVPTASGTLGVGCGCAGRWAAARRPAQRACHTFSALWLLSNTLLSGYLRPPFSAVDSPFPASLTGVFISFV